MCQSGKTANSSLIWKKTCRVNSFVVTAVNQTYSTWSATDANIGLTIYRWPQPAVAIDLYSLKDENVIKLSAVNDI